MSWTQRRVINFAHQGGSYEAPSSTLYAMAQALARGATALELDVHATRDRQLVVCHDETVDRTTNARGSIAELSLADLRELDNAFYFVEGYDVAPGRDEVEYALRGRAPEDRRLGVATLAEVFTAFPGVLINLDIKQTDPDVEGYEDLLAEEIARFAREDTVVVASFHDRALARFRHRAPGVATSAATDEVAAFYFSLLEGGAPRVPPAQLLQVPMAYEGIELVDERFVRRAHECGLGVHVWTLNEEHEVARALSLGVDGVVSDRPSMVSAQLERRGLTWDARLA